MFVVYGFKNKVKTDMSAGIHKCPKCGCDREFFMKRQVEQGHVFWIPVASYTQACYLVCGTCDTAIQVDKKKYKELKLELKQQNAIPAAAPQQLPAASNPAPAQPVYHQAPAQQYYAPQPQQGYAPQPQQYVPQQGYAPQPQQYVPQQGYAPQPQQYVPQQGYAPQPQQNPQGYVPQPNYPNKPK